MASSSLASGGNGDGESVCYLCLGGDLDDDGQPLRRDCACRGTDAGFVHLSCLTKYAATKSQQACDAIEFSKAWRDCPSCHQEYQNELRLDIASKFVSFVRRQYPQNTRRQVESLYSKLNALDSMFERLQPVLKREVGVTANVLLSLIDRMKGDASPLPTRYSHLKHSHTPLMVVLRLTREQKRVLGGQWFTLRIRFKCSKQSAMLGVLPLQSKT